jgi:putative pyruvate formate lyase activating enzyme
VSSIASGVERRGTEPGYLALAASGALRDRAAAAMATLSACRLCPRRCGVDRLSGQLGYCRAGAVARVASCNAHHWEEPPISGSGGSGTIFFSHCTARCLFCQNYSISQLGVGNDMATAELARAMLTLQRRGCHNINLVTPTHYVPQILSAVAHAAPQGLRTPIVYNSSGYETVETLRLLEGIVDIYLPDAKYTDDDVAREISGFDGYVAANRAALHEIKRQVGSALLVDDAGIAYRGMVLRHLVLPEGLSQTPEVLAWVADNLGRETYISLMAQYFPAHRAVGHTQLGRRLYRREYRAALEALEELGLENGWTQELDRVY